NTTSLSGLGNFNAGDFAFGTAVAPAGVSGEAINLGLADSPVDHGSMVSVSIANLPGGWVVSGGTLQADGSWLVAAEDLGNLHVTSASDFTGAVLLQVALSWTSSDGAEQTLLVADNVEVFAAGAPIFAWSGDDTL